MALRQLVLSNKMTAARSKLSELEAARTALEERRAALIKREEELTACVNDVTEETAAEDKALLDTQTEQYVTDDDALKLEETANETERADLERQISDLQSELDGLNARAKAPAKVPETTGDAGQRKEENHMETRIKFFGNKEQRDAFFVRDDVKSFIDQVRSIKTRGVTNGGLSIPDVVLEVLRENADKFSKLDKFVTMKPVSGTARQNIMGEAPEAVWMEQTGALNELDMSLNQIEVDGFMVGGIIFISNVYLEDSDINLGSEIITQLGHSIGKARDRAILYGTGVKSPIGIVTRLAQTSQPSGWDTYAPTWTDLHTTNVLKLNIDGTTGAAFYASLIASLGVANPEYTDGKCFWAMNRKTHIKLMTKALAFDAAAALVAGINNEMPIIGGTIVELGMVADNEIIGGFGSAYLLAERAGAKVKSSEHAKFREMMTAFRGYARYDGKPVFGEAFVVVNFANTAVVETSTFPIDYANTALGVLGVLAAAHGSTVGDTVLTVTGAEVSGTTLAAKVGDIAVVRGQKVSGYTTITSGTTGVTAAAGKFITVVELDAAGKVLKAGKVIAVPKA